MERGRAATPAAAVAAPPASLAPADRGAAFRGAFEALQAGRFAQARDWMAPFAGGDDLEARLLLGLALGGCGAAEAAAPLLTGVATARPTAMHPCLDLVSLLQRQFRVRDSEPVLLACLALTPDDARLQLAHGQLLTELFRFDEAMAAVAASLRLNPHSTAALNQQAIILVGMGRAGDGLALFRRILAGDPENATAWANLGCTLTAEGDFDEALSAYHRSIRIRPSDATVRLNHSITLLKAGRMAQGWQEHEWRFRLPGHTTLPPDRLLPSLGPGADLAGQSVLVTHEEGVGDTLMFLRYVPVLARLGARVVLWVPHNLARLAARVEGVAGIVVSDTVTLDCDWHCPFISLPRALGGTGEPLGAPVPYLRTDPGQVAAAAAHLPAAVPGRLRVGLVWGGAARAANLSAYGVDRRRSVPLAALAPLARLRGVELVSLQFGSHADALRDPPAGLAVADPMGAVQDMDDTASLVRHLDVVLSVDTSIVHLAGGLGMPAILMDRYDNCWRWLHGRSDSPWYPSLRIVRQARAGVWDDVVARVAAMLQAMADGRAGGRRAALP